ncbi:MAG: anion permease [Bacteroidetes bacterium]|nr:anion permease [Bacteroidota bacterium]
MKYFTTLLAGPILSAATYLLLLHNDVSQQAASMAAVVVWVAFWWLTETVDLAITSLLPFIFLPLLGITKAEDVAMQYMNQIIFLFIGGFSLPTLWKSGDCMSD